VLGVGLSRWLYRAPLASAGRSRKVDAGTECVNDSSPNSEKLTTTINVSLLVKQNSLQDRENIFSKI
jgi:hypothetical protein